MSGICGIVDFTAPRIEPEVLRRVAEFSAYRGQGGIAYSFLGGTGFAHLALPTRAEEVDSANPLVDPGHQVCIVLAGRIDNRSDLINRLRPVQGAAVSNAELMRAAYLKWGESCTDHLLGDFAFAIWDASEQRLLCAVDPLGIKSFYYACVGSQMCFASDALQVLQHPDVPDGYNEQEIAAHITRQAEDPARSFFEAVRKLPPGHRLIVEGGSLRVERYWDPRPDEIRYARDEDYSAHFREIFVRAVSDRLRGVGDFVAVTMSGGLDSTSVAAVAHQTSGVAVRAYTFAFNELTECDERAYSRVMTTELGLDVESVDMERFWRLESQAALPVSPDTPHFGWYTCYEEIFHRMAVGGSHALLTGHGGDDLLRGSALIYLDRLRRGDLSSVRGVTRHARARHEPILLALYRQFGRHCLPASINRLLRAAFGRRDAPLLPAFVQSDFARRINLSDRDETQRPQRAIPSLAWQDFYANLVGIPWYRRIANWHDRNAARFGIEMRHPFLDRRLCEYVLAIPGEQLFRLGSTKNLLRRSMEGCLPEKIRLRPGKTSFIPLLDATIRQRAKDEITDLLRAPWCAELGFVDGESLRAAYLDYLKGGAEEARRALWPAITLEIWLRRCEGIRRERRRLTPMVRSAA
jgi:asparagine synthase (glutamine-hydrolysing)